CSRHLIPRRAGYACRQTKMFCSRTRSGSSANYRTVWSRRSRRRWRKSCRRTCCCTLWTSAIRKQKNRSPLSTPCWRKSVSATTGEGVPSLLAELGSQLRPAREFLELRVPHEQAAVIARLHRVGQVIESSYRGAKARFKVRIPPQHHDEFAPFIVA